jgi:signal peptide peptidase SppA
MFQSIRDRLFRRGPVVPVVPLSGVIVAGSRLGVRGLSMEGLSAILRRAFNMRGARAVALSINSPGGSPVQSALIGARIRLHAAEKKIPVIAFVEDVAASGGYWLACAADEIVADGNSIVGSIGVISAGFGFQDAMQRLGVERRMHTSGERKSMLDPFQPEKAEDVERLKRLQAEIHEDFKRWVRERRSGKLTVPDAELFSGEFWTGRRALQLGLVDSLGDLRSTLQARFGDKVRLPVIAPRRALLSRLGMGAGIEAIGPATLAAVEERLLWQRYGL